MLEKCNATDKAEIKKTLSRLTNNSHTDAQEMA
jgi:ethanolamine-phosphate cytidylyltransferase